MKFPEKICVLAATALLGCALLCGCGPRQEQTPTVTVPAVSDTKQPSEYTWREYLAMTEEEQLAFQQKFGSKEVFEAWLEAAMLEDTKLECPWDADGAKQPEDYTWEEFAALGGEYQIAFQKAMGGEAFEAWLNQAQSEPVEYPWDADGAKQPADYTWEEFEALSPEHQIAFQTVLGMEAFEAWMNRVNP